MNNKKYIFLTFALCLLAFYFASGCGRYVTQYSAPVVISRNPALDAGSIPTNESIWVKFSKAIDAGSIDMNTLMNKIKFAADCTAVATFDPLVSPEAKWEEDNTKLTILNVSFVSLESGARVHILASKEAFQDMNGLYLIEGADLWSYTIQ